MEKGTIGTLTEVVALRAISHLSADEIEVLRETASLHASQFYGKISAVFRSVPKT